MKYLVTEVLGDWEAQYGKCRVSFKVEGNDNRLSGFFEIVPIVGAEIEGDIVKKGDFWNFILPKKSSTFQKGGTTPDVNRLEAKIDLLLAGQKTIGGILTDMRGVISELLQSKAQDDGYPF